MLAVGSLAPAVVEAPKTCHITLILRSLHWLKITKRIEYKLLPLTYKVFTTTQPSYLHNLISIQLAHSTRSSAPVTHLSTHVIHLADTSACICGHKGGLLQLSSLRCLWATVTTAAVCLQRRCSLGVLGKEVRAYNTTSP